MMTDSKSTVNNQELEAGQLFTHPLLEGLFSSIVLVTLGLSLEVCNVILKKMFCHLQYIEQPNQQIVHFPTPVGLLFDNDTFLHL